MRQMNTLMCINGSIEFFTAKIQLRQNTGLSKKKIENDLMSS
jgi:hypothetical protein